VKYGTSNGYEFYLQAGNLEDLDRKYLKGTNPLWNDNVDHWTFDRYWQVRDLAPRMKNVHCAVLTVGGWFDAEDLQGPLSLYKAIGALNPETVNLLVEGPWVHGGWGRLDGRKLGNVDFGQNTGEFFRAHILLPFFEKYLKGKSTEELPKAYVFETGSNIWRRYDAWPPKNTVKRTLYFQENNGLGFDLPKDAKDGAAGFDEYVSDPAKPVPYVAYQTLEVAPEYMASDQRFAETRPDVLVYESAVLEKDVTIAGPVAPRLFVSTTGDGFGLCGEADRRLSANGNGGAGPCGGRCRRSGDRPARLGATGSRRALSPAVVEEVAFTMPDINHTFRRGHRIMVQVQSSWFPLVDRNPQTFVDIPRAKPEDFRKATERVYRDRGHASGIEVQVVE
jgi:putative CocE/NonD family hydrolase